MVDGWASKFKPCNPLDAVTYCAHCLALFKSGGMMSALYDEADFAIAKDDDEAKEFITGWMPIETAPRDGRMAIVYRPLARESNDEPVALKRLVEYDNHCWPCTVPKGQKPFNPTDGACHVTHWMPLPTAPTA